MAAAAQAGQPVTQTLNPPPPPYETCKAVGDGTICQGTTTFAYGPIDTADEGPPLVCGSGSGTFDIFDSAAGNSLARRVYDANGNLVRRVRYDQVTDGQNINPLTGAVVPYTSRLTNIDCPCGSWGSRFDHVDDDGRVHRPPASRSSGVHGRR